MTANLSVFQLRPDQSFKNVAEKLHMGIIVDFWGVSIYDPIFFIKQHKAVYLMAVGGAVYLVSKAIRSSRMVAFEDLGMEAIREFEVEDMPVTVAVDRHGESVHQMGPAKIKSDDWRGYFLNT